MASVFVVGTIVFLTFSSISFDIVSGVEFLDRPQNVTLDSSWEQFTLKCRVDVASPNGMDWTAEINGQKKGICSSISSELYNCESGYSAERPNNRTMNLVMRAVDFRNSSVTGKYCCNPDDGQGIPACCYVTVTDVSHLPHTDITEANEATATPSITTSDYLRTSHSESGAIVPIVIGVIVGVIVLLLVILLICIKSQRCPINTWRHNCNNGGNSSVTMGMLNSDEKTTTK